MKDMNILTIEEPDKLKEKKEKKRKIRERRERKL